MTQKKNKIDPEIKEKSKITKDEGRQFTLTVWQIANIKHSEHPAIFPEEIPHRLIKMFSFIKETVLDPFTGIGTTGKVALKLNRKAICVEQNEEYLKILENDLKKEKINSSKNLTLKVADSRNLSFIEDESIGLIVTSPPYWDKAAYGDKDINLGMAAALADGNLIVPVIKKADQLNLVGMTKAVNDLGNRARIGKLKPDDIQGGTYTVTNVGTFGSITGTPIINTLINVKTKNDFIKWLDKSSKYVPSNPIQRYETLHEAQTRGIANLESFF